MKKFQLRNYSNPEPILIDSLPAICQNIVFGRETADSQLLCFRTKVKKNDKNFFHLINYDVTLLTLFYKFFFLLEFVRINSTEDSLSSRDKYAYLSFLKSLGIPDEASISRFSYPAFFVNV